MVLVLGFGSPIFFLSNNPTFYAVPIAAAFACLMAVLVLADHAVRARSPSHAILFLAATSVALGLAVGARPHYLPCVGLLLFPVASLWRRPPASGRKWQPGAAIGLAAVLPVAAVGAALAYYNYRRFDNPMDFGIQYSMASGDLRHAHLMGGAAFWENLRRYLLDPAGLVRYYPFVFSNGQPYGVLPHLPIATAAIFFPLTLVRRSLRSDPGWWVSGSILLGATLLNLAILCTWLLGGLDRYMIDFVPAALLLAGATVLAAVDGSRSWPVLARFGLVGIVSAAALWSLANGSCFGLANRVATPFRARLEYFSDRLVYGIERMAGSIQGPLELTLRFPKDAVGRRDPIVSTGNLLGTGDIVYVTYPDAGHVQFGFFHLGAGGPVGEPVAVDFGVAHTVTVELGSLYPPRRHPMFASWSDEQIAALRHRLEIKLDGRTVLSGEADVYPSMPDGVQVGANRIAADVSTPRFAGQILGARRLGPPEPLAIAAFPGGPVRLRLRWPPSAGANEPLVSTGRRGAGDLLNVEMLPGGYVRFQHDSWNSSDVISNPLPTDVKTEHTVDVEMGSLYCDPKIAVSDAERRRLAVWVDGKLAIDLDRPFNPSTPQEIVFGYNAIGGGSSTAMFTGTILAHESVPPRPIPPESDDWGPVRMTVRFRNDVFGACEPLLTTGEGFAARIIYARFEDSRHVRFGFDRAGSGGDVGPPVEIDSSRPHTVDIALGSLFPATDSPQWSGHALDSAARRHRSLDVTLDGHVVLQAEEPVETVSHRAITIGLNYVNTAHCARAFGGKIDDPHRLPW